MRVAAGALLAVVLPPAAGHGNMNWPPTRTHNSMDTAGLCVGDHPEVSPQTGTCHWFQQGCTIGCPSCTGKKCAVRTGIHTSCCSAPMEPTNNNDSTRTYFPVMGIDYSKYNPWRAPGFAPVMSPCGVAGGNTEDGPIGIENGRDGRSMPPLDGVKTVWQAGSQQEVSWSISANHGGGYAYRLCKKTGNNDESEDCFQNGHLQFASEQSWIQYGKTAVPYGKANRTAIPATTVSQGTKPTGSQWRRSPIPGCKGATGGVDGGCDNAKGGQYPAPMQDVVPPNKYFGAPGLYGFGSVRCGYTYFNNSQPDAQGNPQTVPGKCSQEEYDFYQRRFNFNVIDVVEIPSGIPPGDYLLSFRWDCEQSAQVWANCADVTIAAA